MKGVRRTLAVLLVLGLSPLGAPAFAGEDEGAASFRYRFHLLNWEGYEYDLSITGNGYRTESMSKIGWSPDMPHVKEGEIPEKVLARLIAAVEGADFFSLPPDFPRPEGGQGIRSWTVRLNGREHTVTSHREFGETPEERKLKWLTETMMYLVGVSRESPRRGKIREVEFREIPPTPEGTGGRFVRFGHDQNMVVFIERGPAAGESERLEGQQWWWHGPIFNAAEMLLDRRPEYYYRDGGTLSEGGGWQTLRLTFEDGHSSRWSWPAAQRHPEPWVQVLVDVIVATSEEIGGP